MKKFIYGACFATVATLSSGYAQKSLPELATVTVEKSADTVAPLNSAISTSRFARVIASLKNFGSKARLLANRHPRLYLFITVLCIRCITILLLNAWTTNYYNNQEDINEYFNALGLNSDNGCDMLTKQYHKLAQKFHPDLGGSKETMRALITVYELLKDFCRFTRKNVVRLVNLEIAPA